MKNELLEVSYQDTDNVLNDVCNIIDSARDYTYNTVNS